MSGKKLLVRAMLLSMVWVISGCYRYVPVRVTLTESLTGAPASGKRIRVAYGRMIEFFPPEMPEAVTDSAGQALIQVCTNYPFNSEYRAPAFLSIEPLYVDDPELPKQSVALPVRDYARTLQQSEQRSIQLEPISLGIRVLSLEQWRRKYQ